MPAPSKTEIQTPVPTGAEHRLVVDGDVDLTNTEHLGRILDAAIARSPGTVVVDLTDAGFVGCRGAELLLRSHGALEADGRRMSIRGAHPGASRPAHAPPIGCRRRRRTNRTDVTGRG